MALRLDVTKPKKVNPRERDDANFALFAVGPVPSPGVTFEGGLGKMTNSSRPHEPAHKPGVVLDYDKDGNVVGIEVLNASQRIENPRGVDYAVTGWDFKHEVIAASRCR